MDAAHALFQAVRVPGYVVVEQQVAALEVDAFAGGLGGDQNLDLAFAELLFGVEPGARLVAAARPHAAVDAADAETPVPQPLQQVVEGVLELGEEEEPLFGIFEEAFLPHQLFEASKFRFRPGVFDSRGVRGEPPQVGDLRADLFGIPGEGDRVEEALQALPFGVFHLLEFFEIGKGRGSVERLLPGERQSLLQAFGAVLERPPHRVGARSEAALVERHEEADGPRPPFVPEGRRPPAVALHELGDAAVEVVLLAGDLETDRADDPLGEDLLRLPFAVVRPLREIDHRFLRAAEVEGSGAAVHRLADGLHIGVGVGVEQLQEEGEVLRVAPVRRGGEEQEMGGVVPERLAEAVALALVAPVARRHPVRLVHDDQVPVRLRQAGEDLLALGEVEGGDDLRVLLPLVDAELFADVAAPQDHERFVEFLPEFALPLEGEVRRADHQDALDETAQFQFADEESGHDRLPRPGVVGEQEADAGAAEEMVVHRVELVRERVHPGGGEREPGVVLVGDAEQVGLDPEPQQRPVPVVGRDRGADLEVGDLGGREDDPPEPLAPDLDDPDRQRADAVRRDRLHPHRFREHRPGEDLAGLEVRRKAGPRCRRGRHTRLLAGRRGQVSKRTTADRGGGGIVRAP